MMKAFRGKCHHCGHDHDEEDDAPSASAPVEVTEIHRIAQATLAQMKPGNIAWDGVSKIAALTAALKGKP